MRGLKGYIGIASIIAVRNIRGFTLADYLAKEQILAAALFAENNNIVALEILYYLPFEQKGFNEKYKEDDAEDGEADKKDNHKSTSRVHKANHSESKDHTEGSHEEGTEKGKGGDRYPYQLRDNRKRGNEPLPHLRKLNNKILKEIYNRYPHINPSGTQGQRLPSKYV